MEERLLKIQKEIENIVQNKSTSFLFGEVFTPQNIVDEMLDLLDPSFWNNKDLKILDPCNGVWNFQVWLLKKLVKNYHQKSASLDDKLKEIFDKNLYTCDIQEESSNLYKNIFGNGYTYNFNHFLGDFLSKDFDNYLKNQKIEKFDLIVTNPPYQIGKDSRSAMSIYHKFVEKAIKISDKVIMITPQKWYTNPSMKDFREKMINEYGLKVLVDKGQDVFPTIDLKGGVSYFLLDKNYKDNECLYNWNKQAFKHNLILKKEDTDFLDKIDYSKNFSDDLIGEQYFWIGNSDKRFKEKSDGNDYLCYVSKKNGGIKWIDKTMIQKNKLVDSYKVLIPTASGSKKDIAVLGDMIIAKPYEICSRSYSHFSFESEKEARSFLSYLNTKFAKKLIAIKKQTHLVKKDTFSLLPKIPLDREWTDNEIKKFLWINYL